MQGIIVDSMRGSNKCRVIRLNKTDRVRTLDTESALIAQVRELWAGRDDTRRSLSIQASKREEARHAFEKR